MRIIEDYKIRKTQGWTKRIAIALVVLFYFSLVFVVGDKEVVTIDNDKLLFTVVISRGDLDFSLVHKR